MKKNIKALLALTVGVMVGLAGMAHAQGYPTSFVLNSEVGYTLGGGQVFGASSSTTNTPAQLCGSPSNCGWIESIVFDTVVGTTASVQVSLYDVPGNSALSGVPNSGGANVAYLSISPAAFLIDQFTLVTNSAQVVTDSGLIGAQRYLLAPIKLDYLVHGNLYIATTSNDPVTVTGSVLLGKPSNSTYSVVK